MNSKKKVYLLKAPFKIIFGFKEIDGISDGEKVRAVVSKVTNLN
jgi:hypothetical protein